MMSADFAARRAAMVERQLRGRGIHDERVLEAMGMVPRELFVPERLRRRAYSDGALPIGHQQTISQPWVVAAIAQGLALRGSETVLDVGSGSGYSTAVLARLADRVIGVERIPELAEQSTEVLGELGVRNAEIVLGDGSAGLPGQGPFGAIAVHATAPRPPQGLIGQLKPGGRLVVPIAAPGVDMLTQFRLREGDSGDLAEALIGPCRFVPLIGEQGFAG
jgi:protein-L-isoaspartate(D-aspartate) O-methyltransferase